MTGDPRGARADAGANPAKNRLRAQLRARRATLALPDGDRTRRALDLSAGCSVVACYASVPGEPDSWELIDALAGAGTRILLPVIGPRIASGAGREPDWAWYAGRDRLAPAWRGILQPTGDPLGPAALAQADWIWVPGLAATAAGERLGTGGGWYDRALVHADPATPLGLLLFDGEVLEALPTEPWDRRVDWILTASSTLRTE